MGKLRSLTSDEILAQFFFATKICRIKNNLPKLNNIVFMGMGEPADNADAIKTALTILTDVDLYHIGQTKVRTYICTYNTSSTYIYHKE